MSAPKALPGSPCRSAQGGSPCCAIIAINAGTGVVTRAGECQRAGFCLHREPEHDQFVQGRAEHRREHDNARDLARWQSGPGPDGGQVRVCCHGLIGSDDVSIRTLTAPRIVPTVGILGGVHPCKSSRIQALRGCSSNVYLQLPKLHTRVAQVSSPQSGQYRTSPWGRLLASG